MRVQESYTPQAMGVNGTFNITGNIISGFLAVTAGTLTITGRSGTVYVNAVPLTAGGYTPLPAYHPDFNGGTVTLAGGASGTLFC